MDMRRILAVLCAVGLVVTLGGCAGFHKQAFNKTAHQEIKTLGLLEPVVPEEYVVQNLGHAGMGFGLIGGLIAVADMQSKTNKFTELMKAKDFRLADEFQGALAAELQTAGYSIKALKPTREKQTFLKSYDTLDKEVDAYLDFGVSAGYMCASGTADYVPVVRSGIRLVKRGSDEILYQDLISYGYEARIAEAVNIAANEKYLFENFDALVKDDGERALEGLRIGIPLVTKRIAQDLSR